MLKYIKPTVQFETCESVTKLLDFVAWWIGLCFSQKISIWVNKVNRISVSVWGCAVWKKFPAMAYARTSAGPAGRPGACISQLGPARGQNFHTSPLLIWKSLIGRFYWEGLKAMGTILMKMAVLLEENGSRGHFLFENPSLINFQIGNERKREFRPAEIWFYLHKEFRAAGIRCYLHKEFRAAEIWFSLHKEFLKKNHEKSMKYSKTIPLRGPFS